MRIPWLRGVRVQTECHLLVSYIVVRVPHWTLPLCFTEAFRARVLKTHRTRDLHVNM